MVLKKQNKNEDIITLKFDKGGAMVVMDNNYYIEKMHDHLDNSGCYKKLGRNPIKRIAKEVSKAIEGSSLDRETKEKLKTTSTMTPKIYGLSKIHKDGVPLRPIVETIGLSMYKLAKFLARKLKPLVGNIDTYIKYSSSFIEKIKGTNIKIDDILPSFDVVSLFTMIPINEGMKVIEDMTDFEDNKISKFMPTIHFLLLLG